MPDTALALIITVGLLGGLAAWVPLLNMAEALTRRHALRVAQKHSRLIAEESPAFEREIA